MKTCRFIQAEHQIHILDGLAAGALQEIVCHGMDGKLAAHFLQENKALVCIDDLLEVDHRVGHFREGVRLIVFFVKAVSFVNGIFAIDDRRNKDAAGKIAAPRDEVESAAICWLKRAKGLIDFTEVLMRQRFVS